MPTKEEHIVWTVLPAGITSNALRVSLFISPRLVACENNQCVADKTGKLTDYNFFNDWPAVIESFFLAENAGRKLKIVVENGPVFSTQPTGAELPLQPNNIVITIENSNQSAASSVLWKKLFPDDLEVQAFLPGENDSTLITGYSHTTLHQEILDRYLTATARLAGLDNLLNEFELTADTENLFAEENRKFNQIMYRSPEFNGIASEPSQKRRNESEINEKIVLASYPREPSPSIDGELSGPSSTTINNSDLFTISGEVRKEDKTPLKGVAVTINAATVNAETNTDEHGRYSFTDLPANDNYTITPSAVGYKFEPISQKFQNLTRNQTADFKASPVIGMRRANFHEIVSLIGQYPNLLRALKLVIDFDLPLSAFQTIQRPSKLKLKAFVTLDKSSAKNFDPWTSCNLTEKSFTIASSSPNPFFVNGMVKLTRQENQVKSFEVIQVDPVCRADSLSVAYDENEKDPLKKKVKPQFNEQPTAPLRSAGFAICWTEVRDFIKQQKERSANNNKVKPLEERGSAVNNVILEAEDLFRGFSIDVYEEDDKRWLSLHARNALYTFLGVNEGDLQVRIRAENPLKEIEEGWCSISGSSVQTKSQECKTMAVLEPLFWWTGWSLSAPPVGKGIIDPKNKTGKGDDSRENFKNEVVIDLETLDSSLPKLRFGKRYRLRARVVDPAGNSLIGSVSHSPNNNLPNSASEDKNFWIEQTFCRQEPLPPPVITVPEKRQFRPGLGLNEFAPGEALHRLVIRTITKADRKLNIPRDERILFPPKTSLDFAILHGVCDSVLDNPLTSIPPGKERDDRELQWRTELKNYYRDLKTRNKQLYREKEKSAPKYNPLYVNIGATFAAAQKTESTAFNSYRLDYLPDPLCKGIKVKWKSPVNSKEETVELPFYSKGSSWPNARPWKLALERPAGKDPYHLNWQQRTLTIYVPEGNTVSVKINSYFNAPDLQQLGIWNLMLERLNSISGFQGVSSVNFTEVHESSLKDINKVDNSNENVHVRSRIRFLKKFRTFLEKECHAMVTPEEEIELVHAINIPKTPALSGIDTQTPDKSADIHRESGKTWARIKGKVFVEGQSVERLDVIAEWMDVIDDGIFAKGTIETKTKTHACSTIIEQLPDDKSSFKPQYPNIITLVHEKPKTDGLDDAVWELKFPDHRYRQITFVTKGLSRFKSFFYPDEQNAITFESESSEFHARCWATKAPEAPKIARIVPTFGWTNEITRKPQNAGEEFVLKRIGGGLRIYLERPWYSSGDEEKLAVLVYPQFSAPKEITPFVSIWGRDSLLSEKENSVEALSGYQFLSRDPRDRIETVLLNNEDVPRTDPKTGQPNNVSVHAVPHKVHWDIENRLWYCDLVISDITSYTPFIRLALARYQANSLQGLELSPAVLTDFYQLYPDRTLTVTRPLTGSKFWTDLDITLTGSGSKYFRVKKGTDNQNQPEERILAEITIEKIRSNISVNENALPDPLWWEEINRQVMQFDPTRRPPINRATMRIPADIEKARITVREYELYDLPANPRKQQIFKENIGNINKNKRLIYTGSFIYTKSQLTTTE
jgi:hypothetical protein